MNADDRTVGELIGRVSALESRTDRLEGLLSKIDAKLDDVLAAIIANKAAGAVREAFIRYGIAAAAAIAAVVSAFYAASAHFLQGPHP